MPSSKFSPLIKYWLLKFNLSHKVFGGWGHFKHPLIAFSTHSVRIKVAILAINSILRVPEQGAGGVDTLVTFSHPVAIIALRFNCGTSGNRATIQKLD